MGMKLPSEFYNKTGHSSILFYKDKKTCWVVVELFLLLVLQSISFVLEVFSFNTKRTSERRAFGLVTIMHNSIRSVVFFFSV